ncbi:CUB and sushi domain-containing protein 3-like [Branchiostoma floridae x Branchiostoma japonicum]
MLWCLKLILVTTWMLLHLTASAQEHGGCGAYVKGNSSSFDFVSSPNFPQYYGNNLHCTWTIEVDAGEWLVLTPMWFSLQEGHDWLDVYMGGQHNRTWLGSYTGKAIPWALLATSNMAHLVLRTDESYTDEGFDIGFQGYIAAHITGSSSGFVYSPRYTGQYANMQRVWAIEVNVGEGVKMTPVTFSLDNNLNWLDVYKEELGIPVLLGSYTGQIFPAELSIASNMVHLVLSTFYPNADDGFKIHFEAFTFSAPCPDPGTPDNGYRTGDSFAVGSVVSFGCNHGYVLLGQERLTCTLDDHVGIDWDFITPTCADPAHACAAAGGRYLYEEEGEIVPPRDLVTGRYQNNLNCSWTIVADPGNVVVVEFPEFDIEYEARCRYDFLQLQDRPYLDFYQTFCGRSPPPLYVSMAPVFTIHFHSDGFQDNSRPATGFKIHYYLQDMSEDDRQGYQRMHQLSADSGTFSSMNYPHYHYHNHVYQQWTIIVETHKAVKLTLVFIDTQDDLGHCRNDYVQVVDPYEQKSLYWCGTCAHSSTSTITSAGHSLYVFFVTDFVIRRAGFSARYDAVDNRTGPPTPALLDTTSDWLLVSDGIKQISVNAATNQVWALDEDGRPLRRTGITKTAPQGAGWEVVGTERFQQISVGHVGVWAVYNDSATVMYRVGTYGNNETAGVRWQTVHIGLGYIQGGLFAFEKTLRRFRWKHDLDRIHSGKNLLWVIGSIPSLSRVYGWTIVMKGTELLYHNMTC